MPDPKNEIPNLEESTLSETEKPQNESTKMDLPEEPLLAVDTDLTNFVPQPELNSQLEDETMDQDSDETTNLPENMWVPEPEHELDAEEINQSVAITPDDPEPPCGTTTPPPPPAPPAPPYPDGKPNSEERIWAMLAHLSILLNLISGFLGPVVAFIIYLVYKDKSRYVAYQSLQAFVFQLIWWVGAGIMIAIMWVFVGLLSAIVIGICLIPFAIVISVIPLAALVYGVIGGIQTNQGADFRYWLIGDWLRGTLTGE